MTSEARIEPLPPAERTLPAMLRRGAERHGDRPLLTFGDTTWSHRDLPRLAAARAEALAAAGVTRGDRVALMLSNRIELLEAFVACGWLGAAAVPINTASMGPQIGYLLRRQRRAAAGDRGRLRRAAGERRTRRDRGGGDLGRRPSAQSARRGWRRPGSKASPAARGPSCPRPSASAAFRACGRAADSSFRHPRHPLHLRHHRPGQGRALPSGAVPLVGRAQRRDPRRRRRRRALHDAAALSHQRPQHLRPGLARRRPRRLRAALLGLGLLADDALAPGQRRLPARRDGADPARPAAFGGGAVAPRPHRPRPGRAGERRGGVPRAHRRAAARRLRLDRDQLRHRQRAGPVAPRLHGLAAAGLRGLRRRCAGRGAAAGRSGRAAAARRRAVRLRQRLLRQARGDRRRLAQPLVPHRRPGGARGRRRLPLRRPPQGRDPPPRREHLVVRGRAGAAEPPGGRRGRGLSGALGAGRGRGDGRRRRARGRRDRSGRAGRASAARACRTSRSRATSRSSPTCRAPRTARCRSSSCASAA